MPPQKKEKNLPIYFEKLTPLPGPESGLEAQITAICRRQGEIENGYHALFEDMRLGFEQTKNPLFVWDCYALCRRLNKPVPSWIFEYFDSVASKMMNRNNNAGKLPEILGFKEMCKDGKQYGGKAWPQYLSYTTGREVAARVVRYLRENPGVTIEVACEKVLALREMRLPPWYTAKEVHKWYKRYFP